jgi:hypothetical protein
MIENFTQNQIWEMKDDEDLIVRWEVASRINDQDKLWQMKDDDCQEIKNILLERLEGEYLIAFKLLNTCVSY